MNAILTYFTTATLTFHAPTNSRTLHPQKSNPELPIKTVKQLCEEATPECKLNPLLFNGHLQTMAKLFPPRSSNKFE